MERRRRSRVPRTRRPCRTARGSRLLPPRKTSPPEAARKPGEMVECRKRIALKPHMDRIREWVETGKTDEWIADALGTSASSVQSFRSRNDIYRRERGPREPETVFEGVLDHGERDGWGLWLDPSIAEDPIWKEHWAGVEAVVVK